MINILAFGYLFEFLFLSTWDTKKFIKICIVEIFISFNIEKREDEIFNPTFNFLFGATFGKHAVMEHVLLASSQNDLTYDFLWLGIRSVFRSVILAFLCEWSIKILHPIEYTRNVWSFYLRFCLLYRVFVISLYKNFRESLFCTEDF